ncbi:MAG: MFS transporter [Deltaproteobacteria bacterium]|nr:MFS transporter [Deltaproteobacteria bacterium]
MGEKTINQRDQGFNAIMQMQWLTFAPIAREARLVYNVSALQIDFLSMIFMGVFLVVCIPASYVIDTYGIRKGVGLGALLVGVFGLLKGIYALDYTLVVVSQIGLAVAQPFILNATTRVAVNWFPINERATAVGIAILSQFLGIIVVMIATPLLVTQNAEGLYQIQGVFMLYGIISVFAALLVVAFLRERPPTPPGIQDQDERFRVFEGLAHILRKRDMILMLILFFIGLGMFNAVSTCIDQICQEKGLTIEQTGLVGGMMLIAGIVGAIILPPLSDKFRKRKSFLILGMVGMTPGLVGLTFAGSYPILLVSSFVLGFFLLGACAPVGFQYCAEVSYPAPESTSQGLMLLVGQISGIIFIVGMNMVGMLPFMVLYIALATVTIVITFLIKESPMILSAEV